jgi:4-amino-4-deoxy-L-arabinose transferase-like glycosyltransferase
MPESLARVLSDNRGKLLELPTVEIALGVAIILILLGLRWFYVTTQPWDSDEPQHLHVVWAWANGLLPYKDVFDNHSPLFQAMSAPLFRLLGERADIVAAMRWAMLPIAGLLIGATYWIGARLFSVRAGFWSALLAASFPDLYAKLGEYRPDLFWAALWLVSLAILIGGKMTPGRLFAVGFVFGVAFSVSMKTTFLLLDTVAAGCVVWIIRSGREPVEYSAPKPNVGTCVFAAIIGALVVPIVIIGFFAFKGALSQMYYCVIAHNLTSGANPWHLMIAKMKDIRFWLFVPAIAGGLWLAKQDKEPERGMRGLFFLAATGLFCPLLFAFWPLVSKQDFLPYYPIIMVAIGFLLVAAGNWIRARIGWPVFILPLLVVCWQIASIVRAHPPLKQTNQKNVQIIADTLKLTHPEETVLDAKGQVIFRARPFYYIFEQLTREKAEKGDIKDDAPARLIATRTPEVVASHWLTSQTEEFVNRNYISVGAVMVLGKKVAPDPVGHVQFDIAIPQKYSVVTSEGEGSGTLDGLPINGSRDLSAGRHDLVLNSSDKGAAVIWARAIEKGYSPFAHASKEK